MSEQIGVREIDNVQKFYSGGGIKRKCTYEVLAPLTAMLKAFCLGPWPLEKPIKEGLNFLKMSVEIKRKNEEVAGFCHSSS